MKEPFETMLKTIEIMPHFISAPLPDEAVRRMADMQRLIELLCLNLFMLAALAVFLGILAGIAIKKRTRAEGALRDEALERENDSEEIVRLNSLLESTGDTVIFKSTDGTILKWNRAAEELYGYTEAEAVGKHISFIVPDELKDEISKILKKANRGENIRHHETIRVRNDGSRVPVSLHVSPVKDKSGVVVGIYAVTHNITEIKEAENALHETNVLQRAILDGANYSIISTTKDGTILEFNKAAERMLGYTAEEVIGKVTPQIIHVEDEVVRRAEELSRELGKPVPPGFETFIAKAALLGIPDEHEWTYVRKDGTKFPVKLSITALRDAGGNINGYLGVGQDISAAKLAERAAVEGEARLRAIVDTAVEAIITIDEDGLIETFNSAAETMFEYTASEVAGKNVKILMPSPYHEAHDGYMSNYIRTGVKKLIGTGREVMGVTNSGRKFPIDLSVSEVSLHDRRIFTGIIRDITERKGVERMKNEFISTVSHELRTPLTSIRGSLGMLAGGLYGDLGEDVMGLLSIANNNTERLIALINDMLDIEKIESGKIQVQLQKTDLLHLVQRAAGEMAGLAAKQEVELHVEDMEIFVLADPDRILQVIDNLLSNAVKFSPSGSRVSISARENDGTAVVCVKDNGPGISEQFRKSVFKKFQQEDSSAAKQKGGTGLGLAICKAIVEGHGGQIWFESEPGKGAEFCFSLQLHK